MKRSIYKILFYISISILLLSITCNSNSGSKEENEAISSSIKVSVDPRIELFSAIHRLAGTGQYDENKLPEYIQDVEEYFDPFRDHEAVQMAIRLRESHNLDGNSPMALAVYLTDPPELEGRAPLDPAPEDLDPRWTSEAIPAFLEAVRDFAIETDFNSFFEAHKSFYEQSVSNLQSTLEGKDLLPWFKEYFGYQPDEYVIILGLQNGSCNYGSRVTLENGKREFQSILGASLPDEYGVPQYPGNWYIPTIVHEFCHSYVNPMVDRNRDKLKESGEILFPYHEAELSKSGYNFWFVMMYEYLTRACVVRYLYANESAKLAKEQMKNDEYYGFPAIKGLVELLNDYETQRDKYPGMDEFIPEIVDFFNQYALSYK